MLADYHIHSNYSIDANPSIENIIVEAINKGLNEICFTDHIDFFDDKNLSLVTRPLTVKDPDAYLKEVKRIKEKYQDQIIIKQGMELGIQYLKLNEAQKFTSNHNLDFIIFSVHQINNQEIYMDEYFKNKNQIEYTLEYYEEIYKVMQEFKDYSVLGHLDSIKRYDPLKPLEFKYYKDIVIKILKQAIKDQKGIEINTSSKRYGLDDSTPSKEILTLYHDLGGRIITIGSDSHITEHLGYGILEAQQLLKKIGFKSYCTFDKMTPIFHSI